MKDVVISMMAHMVQVDSVLHIVRIEQKIQPYGTDYYVSNLGEIAKKISNKYIKIAQSNSRRGYKNVTLCYDNKKHLY